MYALPFIILIELLTLNVTLLLFRQIGWPIMPDRGWLVMNLIYVICVLSVRPVAHKRFSRIEHVARKSFETSLLFFLFIGLHIWLDQKFDVNNFHLCVVAVITSFFLFWSRSFSRWCIKKVRRAGRGTRRVVFVGAGHNLAYIYTAMADFLGKSFQFLGYFNAQDSKHLPKEAPRLGTLADVMPWLEQNHPDVLYCNLPACCKEEIDTLMRYCEKNFILFRAVANVRNYANRVMAVEMIDEMPVLMLRREPLEDLDNRLVKRIFDIVVSGLFLITCFWWIFILVALFTKLTMPGPIFFKQKRNGFHGQEFTMIKFRSMKVNAEADTLQATKDDPRKTKWGNIMRKTNIDELPQFINVFRGDMSVVGPRPHMVKHTQQYAALIDKYMIRHLVKPGITGWAQVTGSRGETEELWQMEERVQKDIWYIEHWSIWFDIRIICLTVWNIFRGDKQAY